MEIINENIARLTIPYKDIFTTVYTVKTDKGVLLFDAASFDEDVPGYILPMLSELGITADMLKYVFISHNHKDHSGGLRALMKVFPEACIISANPQLQEKFSDCNVLSPANGDIILDVIKVCCIPGHTCDSAGIIDLRTGTLISGDCLQLYGIYGSGEWAANITFVDEHIDAVQKIKNERINEILTAHDYHPCGYKYEGAESIIKALDSCIEPLYKIKELIAGNPKCDDEQICSLYNYNSNLPTLSKKVVTAVRKSTKICL